MNFFFKIFRRASAALEMAFGLPDHDLTNLKVSRTSTNWSHVYACPLCKSPVGHSEFMTQICLSCGSRMQQLPFGAATRNIVFGGRWIKTVRIDNVERSFVDGCWKPLPDHIVETTPT